MSEKKHRDKDEELISRIVGDLYQIEAIYHQPDCIVLSLIREDGSERALELLGQRLEVYGYRFSREANGGRVIVRLDPRRRLRVPAANVILFVITLLSVYAFPVYSQYGGGFLEALAEGAGVIFTVGIMSILLVHEMGHFVASRRRGIVTSLPYFLPAPTFLGTFGAIIKSKSPFWNRRDLIEVGAAGPIAGWIVALFWLIYGLSNSTILMPDSQPPTPLVFSLEWESLLMKTLAPLLVPNSSMGDIYILSEAAFAGWVGLLITSMNLLPIGQLDGGHILYGALHRYQKRVGWLAMGILAVLGFLFVGWWVFAGLGFLMRVSHPPTLDDRAPPSRASLGMAIASLIILLLSFTPVPFQ